MWPLYSAALIAGLLGSPHCMGMCGPFATASAGSLRDLTSYHAGRIGTYAGLGAVAGTIGSSLPGPGWLPSALALALLLWFSARLAGIMPATHFGAGLHHRIARFIGGVDTTGSRMLFGALTGLIPCGLTWTALALPVAAGDGLRGASVMVVFGMATVPLLTAAAFGLRRLVHHNRLARRGLAAVVLASGVWSLVLRAPTDDGAPACHDTEAPSTGSTTAQVDTDLRTDTD